MRAGHRGVGCGAASSAEGQLAAEPEEFVNAASGSENWKIVVREG
jgi:hypothetical protein